MLQRWNDGKKCDNWYFSTFIVLLRTLMQESFATVPLISRVMRCWTDVKPTTRHWAPVAVPVHITQCHCHELGFSLTNTLTESCQNVSHWPNTCQTIEQSQFTTPQRARAENKSIICPSPASCANGFLYEILTGERGMATQINSFEVEGEIRKKSFEGDTHKYLSLDSWKESFFVKILVYHWNI